MEYAHAKIVKVLDNDDGKERVNILERSDGLFEFRSYVEQTEDGPYASGPYWSPRLHSGLYLSAEEAERDARPQVPWLQSPT
jgi:hypothetical protein